MSGLIPIGGTTTKSSENNKNLSSNNSDDSINDLLDGILESGDNGLKNSSFDDSYSLDNSNSSLEISTSEL